MTNKNVRVPRTLSYIFLSIENNTLFASIQIVNEFESLKQFEFIKMSCIMWKQKTLR